jgi:adenylylsulfate kinase
MRAPRALSGGRLDAHHADLIPSRALKGRDRSELSVVDVAPGFTLWFTGLSGAGKSTLAEAVGRELRSRGRRVQVLDGDKLRQELGGHLGFSKHDRDENVRRIGAMARQLSRDGMVAIAAAISPYRAVRDEVRHEHERTFVEIFVDCPLPELIKRDPKGLYAKALKGEIEAFTGVSDPYEPPLSPEIVVHTDRESIEESSAIILGWLVRRGLSEA